MSNQRWSVQGPCVADECQSNLTLIIHVGTLVYVLLVQAGSLRLLAAPAAVTGNALVVGAESHSIGVAKRVTVPVGPHRSYPSQGQQQQQQQHDTALFTEYHVPRYSQVGALILRCEIWCDACDHHSKLYAGYATPYLPTLTPG
jgi:hypothetical protein